MKQHLKRLTIPKSWPIKKRGIVFITRMAPGAHSFNMGMPLKLILRDILKIAKTSKEVKKILHDTEVLIDGVRRKNDKLPVGFMDVIELKKSGEYFRVVLNKGKISLISIDKKRAEFKIGKIVGKNKLKGKTQINLYDGKNILIDKDDYKTGDSIVISLPKHEIKEHIKLDKGCCIYLIGGKHRGDMGKVEDIVGSKIVYKRESGEIIETLKKYVFVIGKDKPIISMAKKE